MIAGTPGWLNIFLIVFLLLLAFVLVLLRFNKKKPETLAVTESEQGYALEDLTEYVREKINGLTRTNLYELGLSSEEFKKRENKRTELKSALRHCAYGSLQDKQYVKDFIFDMLDRYIPGEAMDLAVPFRRPDKMTGSEIFSCLLFQYKKQFGKEAFYRLVEAYQLDVSKPLHEGMNTVGYVIHEKEIRDIYEAEAFIFSRTDKLEILVQMVYERYKGLGVIDELRDMDIDGISGGVSGVVGTGEDSFPDKNSFHDGGQNEDEMGDLNFYAQEKTLRTCNSVWVFYRGKSIRLAFLGFGTDKELRRVCQNIYRYNKAGQLSESNGYRVSEMKDGSRVVVVRPPFSESWAFFVRKFQTKNMSLEKLIPDAGAALPIQFIRFLAKGRMITALTGSQGCGKTTLLMEMIRHIDAAFPLRIQEMAFELHLRKLYPERNILSFRETETVSGQAGLDLQKKTDGAVNILGEVASDEVSAWMIQMAQVASLFTLFTHHAKTTTDLVLSLRNSLLKCEMFSSEKIAEQQVVSVLDFDIHLTRDVDGHRYIERITEIIGTDMDQPYPEDWRFESEPERSAMRFQESVQQYFERVTDRKAFQTRNIIEYRNGRYVAVHPVTAMHVQEMTEAMRPAEAKAFETFIGQFWGEQPLETGEEITDAS